MFQAREIARRNRKCASEIGKFENFAWIGNGLELAVYCQTGDERFEWDNQALWRDDFESEVDHNRHGIYHYYEESRNCFEFRHLKNPQKAASCAYGKEVVGLIASDEINGKIEEFETRNFARGVYFHKDFKPEGNLMDDVAMIELERDFELTEKLQPACLPEMDVDYTGMQCYIALVFRLT